MIVNIKDFDSSLLEINKLSFKGVFSVIIHYSSLLEINNYHLRVFLVLVFITLNTSYRKFKSCKY